MKGKIRIPTEMYAYVEIEVDGTLEEIEAVRQEANKTILGGGGLSAKDFNKVLDQYLRDGTGETEMYVTMNKPQQRVIQEIKKAFKRMKPEE